MGLRSLSFYGKLVTLVTSDTASQLRATPESRGATGESGGLDASFNGLGIWDDRPSPFSSQILLPTRIFNYRRALAAVGVGPPQPSVVAACRRR